MVPIVEQGKKGGIGHNYKPFLKRFIEICQDHLDNQRSKSFAFIFYDFHNQQIRDIFNNKGGFAQLDRLSGKKLSVFYIDSEDEYIVNEFNQIFLGAFEIEEDITLPSVVFFKLESGEVDNVQIIGLTEPDRMFAFKELYSSIESYLHDSSKIVIPKRNLIPELIEKAKKIGVEQLIAIIIQQVLDKTFGFE